MGLKINLYDDIDVKDLVFLGSGTQGAVYKIDETQCIKIFKKKNSCKEELHSLLLSQSDKHFPKLYSYGDYYIVREYINGLALDEYLLDNPLNDCLMHKIISLYLSMKYVGFSRLDCALFHIFLVNSNQLKLIDTAKAMKKKYSYPKIMINDLNKINYKNIFLDFVQNNYPNIYLHWNKDK